MIASVFEICAAALALVPVWSVAVSACRSLMLLELASASAWTLAIASAWLADEPWSVATSPVRDVTVAWVPFASVSRLLMWPV